jgi:hypothetical protein
MSLLTRPFNEVLARQMQMGALLDTQPQVVDSSAIWAQYGRPLHLKAWLEINRPGVKLCARIASQGSRQDTYGQG